MVGMPTAVQDTTIAVLEGHPRLGRTRRSKLLISIIACAIVGVAAGAPPSADAGTYIVRECSPGTGQTAAPDAVYNTNGALAFTPGIDCTPAGVGVGIGTQGSFAGPLTASWTFAPPSGATINRSTSSATATRAGPTARSCQFAEPMALVTGSRITPVGPPLVSFRRGCGARSRPSCSAELSATRADSSTSRTSSSPCSTPRRRV